MAALRKLSRESGGRLRVVALDVSSDRSVQRAAASVAAKSGGVDVLINNAAVGGGDDDRLKTLDVAGMAGVLNINVVGPLRVAKAFVPVLRKARTGKRRPKITNISSGLGAIGAMRDCQALAYGTSKAGVNYLSRALAFDLKKDGIIVAAVSPGWVRTDMGGKDAPLSPEESAAGIAKVVERLTMKDSGAWFNWNGKRNREW